jgi:hypothetical protein
VAAVSATGIASRAGRCRSKRVQAETLAWFEKHGPASVHEYARDALLTDSGAGQRIASVLGPGRLVECPKRRGFYTIDKGPPENE